MLDYMISEVKKNGITVRIGLGTLTEPPDVNPFPIKEPFRVWIQAFGIWAPTVTRYCARDLAQRLKRTKDAEEMCGYIISILD